MGKISPPQPISANHDLSRFNSIEPTLNYWLQQHSLKNEGQSSRTYVVVDDDTNNRVVGFYCLSTGSVEHRDSVRAIKRNMPNPIPICVLGRLAVDRDYNGKGIGSGLLKEALSKTLIFSKHVGVRALLVHALSDDAKNFYLKYGFRQSPTNNMTLMLSIKDIERALS